jgi:protein-S-isoprenylcysteine O-methyltransferase Ste14
MLVRQLVAILVLPGTVAIAVPVWIVRRDHLAVTRPGNPLDIALLMLGIALFGIGIALFASSLFLFWSRGRGTLAPWDPPRRFVVTGPYRVVRNPMISGVIFVLLAEACSIRSSALAEWAGLVLLINLIYIPLVEEPMLAARFGEPYTRYTKSVRRFLPRLRPWIPDSK